MVEKSSKDRVCGATRKVADNKVDLVCKSCGQAFTAFLRGMAEHNAKVVCPRCGNKQDLADAKDLKRGLGTI